MYVFKGKAKEKIFNVKVSKNPRPVYMKLFLGN